MTATTTEPRFCNTVADLHCTAPPHDDLDDGPATTRATCVACGLPTCTSCSRRTRWADRSRQRVCADCLTDVGRAQEAADIHWHNAGYDGHAPERVVQQFRKG